MMSQRMKDECHGGVKRREGDSLVSKTHPRMDLRSGLLQNQNQNLLLWGLNRLKLLFCLPRL